MGIALIVFAIISVLGKIYYLFSMSRVYQQLKGMYVESNMTMPFWAKYFWFLVLFLLAIDFLILLFGRYLVKHPEQEKEYLYFAIFLLIFLAFVMPILLGYSAWPLFSSFYNAVRL